MCVITHDGDVAARAQRQVRIVDGRLTEVCTGAHRRRCRRVTAVVVEAPAAAQPAATRRPRSTRCWPACSPGPMRSMLTTLGTVLGLASLIATVGLSRTAGSQIVDQFDELSATQVMITGRSNGRGGTVGARCRGTSRSDSTG